MEILFSSSQTLNPSFFPALNKLRGLWAPLRRSLYFSFFTAVYLAGAFVSLAIARDQSSVALFWIPSGLALGMVYLSGLWLAPGIFLAVVLLERVQAMGWPTTLVFATLNTFSVVSVALILRGSRHFRPELKRSRDVNFLILVIVLVCGATGLLAAAFVSQYSNVPGEGFFDIALHWSLAEALSMLALAPIFLTFDRPSRREESWSASRRLEAGALTVLLGGIAYSIFLTHPDPAAPFHRMVALLPLLLWAALRFNPGLVAGLMCLVGITAVTGFTLHLGAFSVGNDPQLNLVGIQIYMGVFVASALIITAVSYDRALLARERESRLRQIANSIPDLVWTTNAEGNCNFWNDQCRSYFGVQGIPSNASFWRTFVHPDDSAAGEAEWLRSVEQGKLFVCEYRLRRYDGSFQWFLNQASPLRDERGEITQWFGAAMNIEPQKQALLELEEEKRIRDRMVFTLSHDIRNPLAIIQAGTQILLKAPPPPDLAQRFLEQMEQNVHRANRMIVDLLDANRLRAGRSVKLCVEEMDLAELARDTVRGLNVMHQDIYRLEAPAELTGFWAGEELRRVMENLCGNAAKYGDAKRGVSVRVGEAAGGQSVTISVHNFGSYVAEEDRARIFQLFHRTDESRHGDAKGWGIGLTLVHGFVSAHGGHVEVASDPVGGTTFSVFLPRDARAYA